jgi:hypothetical protein
MISTHRWIAHPDRATNSAAIAQGTSMIRPLIICALLAPTLGTAQDAPAAYYVGLYRMIGLDDAGPVDEMLHIATNGETLIVSICGGLGSLVLPSQSGDEHYINGTLRGVSVTCDHFNTYQNYPLLACYGDGDSDARLTLFPADNASEPLRCIDN